MRQAGIVAAAGLHALDHHVDRLAEDHANARRFAEAIADLPGVLVDPSAVDTNIVLFELSGPLDADAAVARFAERGIRFSSVGSRTLRAVTHLDVDRAGIDRAIAAARELFV
jgi:threonine aldolase